MNIFYLSKDPKVCAEEHCDKHVVKMILEYAQLLSTAHRFLDGVPKKELSASGRNVVRYSLDDASLNDILYSATHINHPSAVWARKTDQNYIWLSNLLVCLCEEYTHRYTKVHKVERDGLCHVLLKNVPKNIPIGAFSDPTPAMPDDCKIQESVMLSYHKYYIERKVHFARWTNRNVPDWFMKGLQLADANI